MQIFINDETVRLKKTTGGIIDLDIAYTEENINNLYYFLESSPVSYLQIIFNTDTAFRNLESVHMSQADIKTMLLNTLTENSYFNTSFFSVDHIEKNKISINICDTLLSKFAAAVIDKLVFQFNVHLILPFPQWAILNYFALFKSDKNKFQVAIFVIKNNDFTEIVATIKNDKIICYRKFMGNGLSEKDEITKTMQYISREKKIPLDNISIQHISAETLNSFTKPITFNTRFISTVITERNLMLEEYSTSIKIALKALCCSFLLLLMCRIYDLIDVNNKISESQEIIDSVPSYVIAEMDIWKSITNDKFQNVNYRSIISDILTQTENTQIKFLKVETKGINIAIDMKIFASGLENNYSQKITSNKYEFETRISDEEIKCDGKPC